MPIQNNETNNAAVNMDIEEGRINHGASAVQPTAIDQLRVPIQILTIHQLQYRLGCN